MSDATPIQPGDASAARVREHAGPPAEPKARPKARRPAPRDTVPVNSAFGQMVNLVHQDAGGSGRLTDPTKLVIGLPLPALSLRYLLQNDVLPLGRVYQIIGEKRSGKSAFVHEIIRWMCLHEGFGLFLEAENKDSPDLRNSILENRPEWYSPPDAGRLMVEECNSMEDWQRHITRYMRLIDKFEGPESNAVKNDGKPAYPFPYVFCVDSFMSASSERTQEKIQKTGHADLSQPIEANLLSSYARSWPAMFRRKPIILVGTNHLKPKRLPNGAVEYHTPGGAAVGFMETNNIRLSRITDDDKVRMGGMRVRFNTDKNSLGQTKRSITATLQWTRGKDADGRLIQHTRWDWEGATIEMLLGIRKTNATAWKAINEVVDIREAASGKKASSKELGVADPVPYSELGAVLETRPDVLRALYPIFGIKERTKYRPRVDFERQIEEAYGEVGVMEAAYRGRFDAAQFEEVNALLGQKLAAGARRPLLPDDDEDDDGEGDADA